MANLAIHMVHIVWARKMAFDLKCSLYQTCFVHHRYDALGHLSCYFGTPWYFVIPPMIQDLPSRTVTKFAQVQTELIIWIIATEDIRDWNPNDLAVDVSTEFSAVATAIPSSWGAYEDGEAEREISLGWILPSLLAYERCCKASALGEPQYSIEGAVGCNKNIVILFNELRLASAYKLYFIYTNDQPLYYIFRRILIFCQVIYFIRFISSL
jgi:hypothetical protein